jgi:PAS domain S-box-containing protein
MTEITNRQHLFQVNPAMRRYALTVLAVVSTLALRLVLYAVLTGRAPYLLFFLVVVIVKSFWGRGPALLATALGGLSAWYFLIQPLFAFTPVSSMDLFNLARFFVVGITISCLGANSIPSFLVPVTASINTKLRTVRQTAALAGAVAVLAGMGLLLYHDFESSQDAQGWVAHTFRVMNSAEAFLSSIKDAETGERGFILTGDERFLARYKSAVAAVPTRLKELKDLTSDNQSQQTRWVEINRLTQERLSMLKRGIDLRTASGVGPALAAVRSGQGEEAMDKLRSALDAFVVEERQLLVERTAKAKDQASRVRWVQGLGSLALIILLVLASVVIERETIQREEIARHLRRRNDLLEQAHDSLLTSREGGVIDYWSRGAETLYGYSREEAVGRFSHELLQAHQPLGIAQIDSMLERDGHWTGQLTQTTKDGRMLITDAVWTLAVEADGSKTVLQANHDITARKQAEDEAGRLMVAVQQERDRLSALLNSITDEVWFADKERKFTLVNRSALQEFGDSDVNGIKVETLAQSLEVFRSDGSPRPVEEAPPLRALAGEVIKDQEEIVRTPSKGELRYRQVSAAPVKDAAGNVIGSVLVVRDITEQKRAEKERLESEERFRALITATSDVVYRMSADWNVMRQLRGQNFINDTDEPNRNWLREYIHQDDQSHVTAVINEAIRTKSIFELEHRVVRVDGTLGWTFSRAIPLLDANGEIVEWFGAASDITERKRAEKENLLLATAIEQAAETVVITDRDALIQYVNPAFTRTTGYTRAEALGLNPRILKSGRHDGEFYRDMWAALNAGKLWFGEFTNRRCDGTLYTEEATIAPVRDAQGEITNYIAIKSDITERKKSETALRESERMLSFFVQHAPAAIAMVDRDMRYLVVSQRWMTDYRLGDRNILGLSHYEVFPEIPERWKEIHRRCLAGAVESCEEDPFTRGNGSLDWLRWEIRPWRKLDNSVGGIIMFSELITERKQAVEALKRSEYSLRESQRVGRIGSYELDIASGRWSSSAVLDEIFGIGRNYCRDVNGWLALMRPGPRAELAAYFQEIIAEKKRFERDYQIVRLSDGAERWVSGKGELILDGQSQPIKMIGTIQDITEQREAEAARKESELRYRQLFERSESAMGLLDAVFDAEGNPSDLRYVEVNPVYEQVTGLSRTEILGRTLLEVRPEVEKSVLDHFCRVATNGEPFTFELNRSGTDQCVSGSAYSPAPNQVAVTFVDVTERKQAEDKIRLLNIELEERVRARTAELEVANRELEAFARSVSHDLRAPLRSIDGWSLALLEDCSKLLDAQGLRYLDRVRSEAQRMGTLIDDILHLSRVSRGELDLKSVDLTCLAGTIVNRLKEAHADRSIDFIVASNLYCTGDPRLLEVALTNLFGNAVKFTGPRVDARVEFGQTDVEGSPAFFVRDNGVGFEMAYAEMLFAPFQRLHKASEFPGSGIGLATVQRVVHRHGGRIWAEARVGEGATLYFTLGADEA